MTNKSYKYSFENEMMVKLTPDFRLESSERRAGRGSNCQRQFHQLWPMEQKS
jgi:hypothetical protein